MFNGLAGFIFGNKSPSSTAEETNFSSIPAGRDDEKNEIKKGNEKETIEIVDGDEEWLVVDVKAGENALKTAMTSALDLELDVALPPNSDEDLPSPTADERGWNLTPPPCFTASFQKENHQHELISSEHKKRAPISISNEPKMKNEIDTNDDDALNSVLETSNFENLLIEHPSIFIKSRPSNQTQGKKKCTTSFNGKRNDNINVGQPKFENQNQAESELPIKQKEKIDRPRQKSQQVAPAPRPNPPTVAEVLFGAELSMKSIHRADLKQQQQTEFVEKQKEFGLNRIRRSNVATVAAAGQNGNSTPRKRRMKNFQAGRCNDRKCQ